MQTISLFSVGIVTLATIVHSSKPTAPKPESDLQIAVIDYASIIEELEGVNVYSYSDNAIDLSSVSKTQKAAVLETIDEIDKAVAYFCETHRISMVLRRSRKERDGCRRRGLSQEEVENKLLRQLNRSVIYESKMDITTLILHTVKKNRE